MGGFFVPSVVHGLPEIVLGSFGNFLIRSPERLYWLNMGQFSADPYTLPQLKQGIAMLVGLGRQPIGDITTLMVSESGDDPSLVESSSAHTTFQMAPLRQIAFHRVRSRSGIAASWLFVGPCRFFAHELDFRTVQDDVQHMVREAVRRKIEWPYEKSSVSVPRVEMTDRKGSSLLVEIRILLDD